MDVEIARLISANSRLEEVTKSSIITTNKKIRKYRNRNYQTLKSIFLSELKQGLYGYFCTFMTRVATDSSRFVKSCYWDISLLPNGDIGSVQCVPKNKGDGHWLGERTWIEKLSGQINNLLANFNMGDLSFLSQSGNVEEFNINLVPSKASDYKPDFSIPELNLGDLLSIKF